MRGHINKFQPLSYFILFSIAWYWGTENIISCRRFECNILHCSPTVRKKEEMKFSRGDWTLLGMELQIRNQAPYFPNCALQHSWDHAPYIYQPTPLFPDYHSCLDSIIIGADKEIITRRMIGCQLYLNYDFAKWPIRTGIGPQKSSASDVWSYDFFLVRQGDV